MRTILLALAAGAALSFGGFEADAMPMNAVYDAGQAPALTLVADGCGPGFHRGAYGRCRPNGFFRPRFERRCFVRPTPYGPRRVCR